MGLQTLLSQKKKDVSTTEFGRSVRRGDNETGSRYIPSYKIICNVYSNNLSLYIKQRSTRTAGICCYIRLNSVDRESPETESNVGLYIPLTIPACILSLSPNGLPITITWSPTSSLEEFQL